MKRVLILQANILMHPADIERYTKEMQTDIDNGNVLILPIWVDFVGLFGDEGNDIKVEIRAKENREECDG